MLTQRKLSQLIADLWAMSASMNAAAAPDNLTLVDGVLAVPCSIEWLERASESVQKAAEDLELLLDDDMPVERPPRTEAPILAIVKDEEAPDASDT